MNLVTTAQIAKEWNISQRRVDVLCKEGRIEGVVMMGNRWFVPDKSPQTSGQAEIACGEEAVNLLAAEKTDKPRRTPKKCLDILTFSAELVVFIKA